MKYKNKQDQLLAGRILEELEICNDTKKIERKEVKKGDVDISVGFITVDLRSVNGFSKDFNDYKFWLTLSQQRMNLKEDGSGDFVSAMDYLRNGLQLLPLSPQLLFNFGNVHERIGEYETAIKFFKFAQLRDEGWSDAYYGEGICQFEMQNFKNAKKSLKMAIKNWEEGNEKSKEDIKVLKYVLAMSYKNLKKYDKAAREYSSLNQIFTRKVGFDLLQHVTKLVMLPLQTERGEQYTQLEKHMKIMEDYKAMTTQRSKQRLDRYTGENGYLNMKDNGTIVYHLLKDKPFFKRFSKDLLLKYLVYAKPKFFKERDIVFTQDRVGLITSGSVKVNCHNIEGMLNPITIGVYGVGQILGHQSDDRLTNNSQTWIVNYNKETEILFFDTREFNKLWDKQNQFVDKSLIEKCLMMNPLIRCLNDQSIKQIVHEDVVLKKYRPGQMICRMNKRSRVNMLYDNINDYNRTLFKTKADELIAENKVNNLMAGETDEYGKPISAGKTALSGIMKEFKTKMKRNVNLEIDAHKSIKAKEEYMYMSKMQKETSSLNSNTDDEPKEDYYTMNKMFGEK